MMARSAVVALKQHRVEVALGAGAALTASVAALIIDRLLGATLDGASFLVGVMRLLPFVVGLFGGIPVVSRELEARTAQFSWALYGSRRKWLWRQVLPIGAVLGIAVILAAVSVTQAVGKLESISAESAFLDIGTHGLPAIVRAFAAFGIGLLVGSLVGRALPALALGALLCLVVVAAGDQARSAWLSSTATLDSGLGTAAEGIQTGWLVRSPDGSLLDVGTAVKAAPDDGQEPTAWLEANGYTFLAVGVPRSVAMQWEWYDVLLFGSVGGASVLLAAMATERRRPV